MSTNKKNILAGIFIFTVFASVGVFQSETQAQEEPPLVAPDAVSQTTAEGQKGQEILALLADLKSVTLDESIFSDRVFQALQDTSVELVAEPKGRPNPFAPLGKDAVLDESVEGVAITAPRDIPFNSATTSGASKSKSVKPVK